MEIVIKSRGYECERCHHQWIPRGGEDVIPLICPHCKSAYWNRKRRTEQVEQEETVAEQDG